MNCSEFGRNEPDNAVVVDLFKHTCETDEDADRLYYPADLFGDEAS